MKDNDFLFAIGGKFYMSNLPSYVTGANYCESLNFPSAYIMFSGLIKEMLVPFCLAYSILSTICLKMILASYSGTYLPSY